jgi:hypothetical protein
MWHAERRSWRFVAPNQSIGSDPVVQDLAVFD